MRYRRLDETSSRHGGDAWAIRHEDAVMVPSGIERPLRDMLQAWQDYAIKTHRESDHLIGEDGVLGAEWTAIGKALRGLLNGPTGRFDCGTVDGWLLRVAAEHGANLES